MNPFVKTCLPVFILLLVLGLSVGACAQTDAELWEAYQQPNVRADGQAYLEFIPSLQPVYITAESRPIWRFDLFITEKNGVPFTADTVSFTRFDAEHNVIGHVVYTGSEYAASHMPAQYLPGESMHYALNQPADASAHYGVQLSGVDANGSACSFRTLVPLSQEMLPVECPDDFLAPDEGDPLITLTPSADPVYLEHIEFFGGGLGWSSSLTVTNVSDSPVELTGMRMIMFMDQESVLLQKDYSHEAIAIIAGAESNLLAPGETLEFSDLCPYQDLIGYGYRFTAQTQDGRTQTANCFYACAKEEAP